MAELSVFQRIASGELPSYVVARNNLFIVILDAFPSVQGQLVGFTREWHPSDVTQVDPIARAGLFNFLTDTAAMAFPAFSALQPVVMFEGYGVSHFHGKAYPIETVDRGRNFEGRSKLFDGPMPREFALSTLGRMTNVMQSDAEKPFYNIGRAL